MNGEKEVKVVQGSDGLTILNGDPIGPIAFVPARLEPSPYSIAGRVIELEKRFERLLVTLIEGESRQDREPSPYVESLKQQLEEYRGFSEELRVILEKHPRYYG